MAQRIVRMVLAYEGTHFRGWAAQRAPGIRTVEGVLTERLASIVRHDVRLSVAGRTDAGVHARGQVASFLTTSTVEGSKISAFLNGELAPEVVVREAADAPAGFDARLSASAREYVYVIGTSELPDPFVGRFQWHRPRPLSVPAMREAARVLLGEHDFASFCRHPGLGRPTARDLQRLSVRRHDERIVIGLRANAFLHQMVRVLVGTLVLVGEGKLAARDVARILEARDRSAAPRAAPPQGLTLERVIYGPRRPR